jgi:D-alanine-D-alanine ligase
MNKLLNIVKSVSIVRTDVQRKNYSTRAEFIADSDVVERAEQIAERIEAMGLRTNILVWSKNIATDLMNASPDIVVNLVESVDGSTLKASLVPGFFELLGIPYTGASTQAYLLSSSKSQFKDHLFEYSLPTPRYQLITSLSEKISQVATRLPVIVKPNLHIGGSVGLDDLSVCVEWEQVGTQVKKILEHYSSTALIEEFIEGRELSVILIEQGNDLDIYFGEKVFNSKTDKRKIDFLSWDAVWKEDDAFAYSPYVDKSGYLTSICRESFKALGLTGYAKYDIRLNNQNRPYIIDINPNCSLGPNDNAINLVPALSGVKFEDSLVHILNSALTRK